MRSYQAQTALDEFTSSWASARGLNDMDRSGWTQAQRKALLEEQARFILANASIFPDSDIAHAQSLIGNLHTIPDKTPGTLSHLWEGVKGGASEAVRQIDRINPFSENSSFLPSVNQTTRVIAFAAIALALVYGISQLKTLTKK